MNNEKQENERLQHELRQIVDKYSVLLQRLLERCDQLVKERDQLQKERDELVKERDQLVKENQRLHDKECSKKQTSYQCSPAMATCDGLYNMPI
jgi:cell division protein FtsB